MRKILFAFAFIPIFASAADWKNISQSSDMMMQIDTTSISLAKNGARKAWVEFIYTKPQKSRKNKSFLRSVTLFLYNCSERTVAPIQEVDYDHIVNGIVVNSAFTPQEIAQFIDVVPGSFNEDALNFVCGEKIQKK